MKKLVWLVALIPFISVAQSSYPLVKEGATWRELISVKITVTEFHMTKYQYLMKGDTLMDGQAYRKVYESEYDTISYNLKFIGGMREDTVGKIWFNPRWMNPPSPFGGPGYPLHDTVEFLLYDFSLQVGDTFFITQEQDSNQVVLAIDTVLIGNSLRRSFTLAATPYGLNRNWIEGIGDTQGLFFPTMFIFENWNLLNCYEDSSIFWTNPELVQNGLNCFNVDIEERKPSEEGVIEVFPNPAEDVVFFTFHNLPVTSFTIELYNSYGGKIKSQYFPTFSSVEMIDINELPKGVCFYRVMFVDGSCNSGKIIKL